MSWLQHQRNPNVTTTLAVPRLWWHLGVSGVTPMTSKLVSSPSFYAAICNPSAVYNGCCKLLICVTMKFDIFNDAVEIDCPLYTKHEDFTLKLFYWRKRGYNSYLCSYGSIYHIDILLWRYKFECLLYNRKTSLCNPLTSTTNSFLRCES